MYLTVMERTALLACLHAWLMYTPELPFRTEDEALEDVVFFRGGVRTAFLYFRDGGDLVRVEAVAVAKEALLQMCSDEMKPLREEIVRSGCTFVDVFELECLLGNVAAKFEVDMAAAYAAQKG